MLREALPLELISRRADERRIAAVRREEFKHAPPERADERRMSRRRFERIEQAQAFVTV